MERRQAGTKIGTASKATMVTIRLDVRPAPPTPPSPPTSPGQIGSVRTAHVGIDDEGARPPPDPLLARAARPHAVRDCGGLTTAPATAGDEGLPPTTGTSTPGEGAPPAPLPARAARPPAARDGGAFTTAPIGDDAQIHPAASTTPLEGATLPPLSVWAALPPAARDGEGLISPRITAAGDYTIIAVKGGVKGEGMSLSPQKKQRPTSSPVQSATGASPFSVLPDELITQIARHLRSSRIDVENMRWVSHTWRELIPSTIDPFIVFSLREPKEHSEVLLFEIARTKIPKDACLTKKFHLSHPPAGSSCWGSALGLMAMQSYPLEAGKVFAYCLHCGSMKSMLEMPKMMIPAGLFLEPYTPQRFVLAFISSNGDTVLRVDRDQYPWILEGGPWWLPTLGFKDTPLSTVALSAGVLCAVATKNSIIILEEWGQDASNDEVDLHHIHMPGCYLLDGSPAVPWEQNGRHLFICEHRLHFAEIFHSSDAPDNIIVRLFVVHKSEENGYSLIQTSGIGEFSVYLGPNQSFVLPASDFIGRQANLNVY